jgi:hypothetical protein
LAIGRRIAQTRNPVPFSYSGATPEQRLATFLKKAAKDPAARAELSRYRTEWARVALEIADLASYVWPKNESDVRAIDHQRFAEDCIRRGVRLNYEQLFAQAPKPRGRPVSVGIPAVEALELKLAPERTDAGTPKPPSWTQIAKKLCHCDKEDRTRPGHLVGCAQRIRQATLELKRTLTKYGIDIPLASR